MWAMKLFRFALCAFCIYMTVDAIQSCYRDPSEANKSYVAVALPVFIIGASMAIMDEE